MKVKIMWDGGEVGDWKVACLISQRQFMEVSVLLSKVERDDIVMDVREQDLMIDGVEEDDEKDAGNQMVLDLELWNGLFGENGDELSLRGLVTRV